MKNLISIVLIFLALCISCKGKSTATIDSENNTDSVTMTGVKMPLEFLNNLGIKTDTIIAVDSFPLLKSDLNIKLNKNQKRKLVSGIIAHDYAPDTVFDANISITDIGAINDQVAYCIYDISYPDDTLGYIVTYKNTGDIIDAVFIGEREKTYEPKEKLIDSIRLIAGTKFVNKFINPQQFTYSYQYKEIEHGTNYQDSTTYVKTISMGYNIANDGKIELTKSEKEEEGIYKFWQGGKYEFDLFAEMIMLIRYPYSDESALERWQELGTRVDGAPAESFCYYFYKYVFVSQPQKVLRWIYNNRNLKSLRLSSTLWFYYSNSKESRDFIDSEIAKLDNPAMRDYYKELKTQWVEW